MKINGIDELIKNGNTQKNTRTAPVQNDDFKKILKASVDRTTHHTANVQQPLSMNPGASIRLHPMSSEFKNAAVEHVDKMLNLLENYHKQLADPTMTLKNIEPAMNAIIKEKEQLSSVLDALSGDDRLKDIANRTLITASLEVIKYNRGDYITS